ncbi:hypothetical protein DL763_007512 [Monosporascus cannonballus]|nr:hypothetical protein DL763_007512 [Monosporascus cannonballus]
MDEFLFNEQLGLSRIIPEATHYLEILNYSHPDMNRSEWHPLSSEDFDNFLARKGVFAPPELENGVTFTGGLRLVLHQLAENADAFSPHVISLPKGKYEALARILSGYVKGTENADVKTLIPQVQHYASSVAHPLLLPVLILCRELSQDHDKKQRDARQNVRKLEETLLNRYRVAPAAGYGQNKDLILDSIIPELRRLRCEVLWKRPQTWHNVAGRMLKATNEFWDSLEEHLKDAVLQKIHQTILSRLDFVSVKLEGLEGYTQVTLERMDLLRELMNSIIGQVESRLSVEIATQQHRLADASRRDSISMKTLAILGAVFLPGTFLATFFSMPFFDFCDKNDAFSSRIGIYFVIMVPLTLLTLGTWWKFNQMSVKEEEEEDVGDTERRVYTLEARIMQRIRRRTGLGIGTWEAPPA